MSNKQIQRGWQFAALVGLIASLILMLLVSLLSGSRQVSAEFGMEWPEIEFVPLISRGLSNPVQLIHAGDSSGRLFIVEKGGLIRIYKDGVLANIANFHQCITAGNFDNPTVAPSVRSNLVTILGRTAAYEGRTVTWEEVLKDDRRIEPDLGGLKA